MKETLIKRKKVKKELKELNIALELKLKRT